MTDFLGSPSTTMMARGSSVYSTPAAPSSDDVESKRTKEEMKRLFKMCRDNQWSKVLEAIHANPQLGQQPMIMDNHIVSTVLHQAITSKGDVTKRAMVMKQVLHFTPRAASIKNGYNSLPLHVITQRNTKMTSSVKEDLIILMIDAYPEALVIAGGTGKRTPLHVVVSCDCLIFVMYSLYPHRHSHVYFACTFQFTDYVNPRLVNHMIKKGSSACYMEDKKGWLPIHVACSRHCSPEKLKMLLEAYPDSLHATTGDGQSLLDLAKETATTSHPNFALIAELNRQFGVKYQRGSVPPPKRAKKKNRARSEQHVRRAIRSEPPARRAIKKSKTEESLVDPLPYHPHAFSPPPPYPHHTRPDHTPFHYHEDGLPHHRYQVSHSSFSYASAEHGHGPDMPYGYHPHHGYATFSSPSTAVKREDYGIGGMGHDAGEDHKIVTPGGNRRKRKAPVIDDDGEDNLAAGSLLMMLKGPQGGSSNTSKDMLPLATVAVKFEEESVSSPPAMMEQGARTTPPPRHHDDGLYHHHQYPPIKHETDDSEDYENSEIVNRAEI